MNGTYLIVGLGNPGAKYASTRHNIGHMVLDHIAEETGARFKTARRARARVIEGRLGAPGSGTRVVFAETTSFMNVSGAPVASLAAFHGIDPENVVVVHDDIDLAFGTIRLKRGGGEGGHNGLRDITRALGTKDYLRVRIGVDRPGGGRDAADHVLAPFTGAERRDLPTVLADAADAASILVLEGLGAAQQKVHSREGR